MKTIELETTAINILKIFSIVIVLIIGTLSTASAQNYYSKPEATKNLGDAAKYLVSTLDQLEENDAVMYKVNKEKIRFINNMLKALKQPITIQEAVDAQLPKDESFLMQPAVRFIDTSFSGMTPNKYIRAEILFLISY